MMHAMQKDVEPVVYVLDGTICSTKCLKIHFTNLVNIGYIPGTITKVSGSEQIENAYPNGITCVQCFANVKFESSIRDFSTYGAIQFVSSEIAKLQPMDVGMGTVAEIVQKAWDHYANATDKECEVYNSNEMLSYVATVIEEALRQDALYNA